MRLSMPPRLLTSWISTSQDAHDQTTNTSFGLKGKNISEREWSPAKCAKPERDLVGSWYRAAAEVAQASRRQGSPRTRGRVGGGGPLSRTGRDWAARPKLTTLAPRSWCVMVVFVSAGCGVPRRHMTRGDGWWEFGLPENFGSGNSGI
ncbi:uncharacterized protein [Zea mays]|uniref:uncharacterized protein n=1 Tax=Zea mays TaxID=4577 RepID=UPI0002218494|nr:uncharacterized protein LOC103643228 [Zea mays]|eukprot:XP_008664604.1 uncharacterized protein LOC103643228 [Zea mays]